MFLEFNWTANVYQLRFGDTFIDLANGERSWPTRLAAQFALSSHKLRLAEKTDSRTWRVVATETEKQT